MSRNLAIPARALLATLILTSCAASRPLVTPPAYPQPLTPEEAVLLIQDRTVGLQGIYARMSIRTERGTLASHLWAETGGRLRIHARRLVWSAMDLLIDGDRVVLHMPRRSKALVASLSELGVRAGPLLASRDLLLALLGSGESGWVPSFREGGKVLIISGEREVWSYDREHLLLRRLVRRSPEGEKELEVTVGEYRSSGGGWWPTSAVLETPEKVMEIRLEAVEENPTFGPDVFRIDLPEETEMVKRMQDLD